MVKILKRIYQYITSRYTKVQLLILVVIIVFAFFISDSSIFDRLSSDAKISELNEQIDFYREKAVKDREQLEQLHSNKSDIEKFARESYLMKKPDEDVFVLE